MPTIMPVDTLLTAAGNLRIEIYGGIPQSQYNNGIVNQFMAILNANNKSYQHDSTLQQRVQSEKAKEQTVAAAIGENGEDAYLDDPEQEEALPEVYTPSANTRSCMGSNQ